MNRLAAVVGVGVAAHVLPSVLTIPWLSRTLLPALSGTAGVGHVALTFDDGPDPASTPAVLDRLAELRVRATFFVLGTRLSKAPRLGERIRRDGHELAVHGWVHRPHLLRSPAAVVADVRRTRCLVEDVTGQAARYWRPPNGILSGAGLLAAAANGLRPVLWTADGQDWRADATPQSIADRIGRQVRGGGVVLLHDSDVTSARGSWRAVVTALPAVVNHCTVQGWTVGPLSEHFR